MRYMTFLGCLFGVVVLPAFIYGPSANGVNGNDAIAHKVFDGIIMDKCTAIPRLLKTNPQSDEIKKARDACKELYKTFMKLQYWERENCDSLPTEPECRDTSESFLSSTMHRCSVKTTSLMYERETTRSLLYCVKSGFRQYMKDRRQKSKEFKKLKLQKSFSWSRYWPSLNRPAPTPETAPPKDIRESATSTTSSAGKGGRPAPAPQTTGIGGRSASVLQTAGKGGRSASFPQTTEKERPASAPQTAKPKVEAKRPTATSQPTPPIDKSKLTGKPEPPRGSGPQSVTKVYRPQDNVQTVKVGELGETSGVKKDEWKQKPSKKRPPVDPAREKQGIKIGNKT